jgi:hypothetical protein
MVIPNPLIIPHTKPTAGATRITICQGSPALDEIARAIKESMSIDPTDKSIPAVTITMNTPSASMACQDICLKIFVIFLQEKKLQVVKDAKLAT